jgi:hypothetical protein
VQSREIINARLPAAAKDQALDVGGAKYRLKTADRTALRRCAADVVAAEIDVQNTNAGICGGAPRLQLLAEIQKPSARNAHVDEVQLLTAALPRTEDSAYEGKGGLQPCISQVNVFGYKAERSSKLMR